MPSSSPLPSFAGPQPGRRLGWVAVVAAALIVLVDAQTPLGVPDGVLYVIVVLLGLWARESEFALLAAGGASLLVPVGAWLSPAGDLRLAVLNRVLSVALIWMTALLVHRYRRAADALAERTEQARQYLELADVIFVSIGADERVSMINRRGAEILGLSQSGIVGSNWFNRFIPAREREAVRAVFHRLLAGEVEAAGTHENSVLTSTGEERLIAWRNVTFVDATGRTVGTLSSGEDVTAERQAAGALRRSLKELEDLKYAIDQAAIVATTDTKGIIKFANRKFCEISKYAADELLGQDHRIINSAYHPKEFMRDLWRTIAAGRIWRGEIRNRAKDGSLYWVDTTIVPFLDERGHPYQYMAIRNDITERKLAQARLQEQATLARLGQMAAVVAHEVRNPLAGIRGALQVIGGRMPAESRDRAVIGEILARVDALDGMVQDLLLFARPRPPRTSPVAVRDLIEATVTMFRKDPQMEGVGVEIAGANCVIEGDADQLTLVFLNLLINSAQAMDVRGAILVAVESGDDRCEVSVRDAGPGIPADAVDKIFEPFFTTKTRGAGLGLPIARHIVEQHRGTIVAESPAGGGTLMRVSLPLASPLRSSQSSAAARVEKRAGGPTAHPRPGGRQSAENPAAEPSIGNDR